MQRRIELSDMMTPDQAEAVRAAITNYHGWPDGKGLLEAFEELYAAYHWHPITNLEGEHRLILVASMPSRRIGLVPWCGMPLPDDVTHFCNVPSYSVEYNIPTEIEPVRMRVPNVE